MHGGMGVSVRSILRHRHRRGTVARRIVSRIRSRTGMTWSWRRWRRHGREMRGISHGDVALGVHWADCLQHGGCTTRGFNSHRRSG